MLKDIDLKMMGGILLIVGTSIGAGMLALPIANAATGFVISSSFLFFCWALMTFSAFLILEVNLWCPRESNMISMAKITLGRSGEVIAWVSYFLLLYTLLTGYIAGGSDILQGFFQSISGFALPQTVAAIFFVVVLAYVVIKGIRSVDKVNRVLMASKLGSYALLVILILPHVDVFKLQASDFHYALSPLMLLITAFGYAIIVPSLRTYFEDDVSKLRKVILIGSFIPLLAYLVWDAVIMGVIPREGAQGLMAMLNSSHSTTDLTIALNHTVQSKAIAFLFRLFTSISMLTAFLGVSLCLCDFLSDGYHLEKRGQDSIILYGLTFIPPLIIVLFFPGIFIQALKYAGIACVILLMLLPALMAYNGRYRRDLSHGYQVIGGRVSIILTLLSALVFLGIAVYQII